MTISYELNFIDFLFFFHGAIYLTYISTVFDLCSDFLDQNRINTVIFNLRFDFLDQNWVCFDFVLEF